MSELTYQATQDYLTSLVPLREQELQEMEAYAEKHNFPIIGPHVDITAINWRG